MINLSINRNKPELLRNMYYKDVIVESKLLGSPIIVFNYIFQWISSETPPETIIINNSVCYYCTINKIADDTMLSVNSVRESIDKLINGTIQLIDKFYDSKSHKLYLKIYPENIRRILAEGITSNDKYFNYLNEYEEINVCENSFFEELKVVKKYSKESEDLVVSLLEKNSDIFKTRIPKNLDNPTKTFEKACKIMQDIYNGNFTNAKFYYFAPSFENDNRFAVDGWRDMISDVKGNWDKIYYDFMNKTPLTDEEFEIGKKYADKYITIVDNNYPYEGRARLGRNGYAFTPRRVRDMQGKKRANAYLPRKRTAPFRYEKGRFCGSFGRRKLSAQYRRRP